MRRCAMRRFILSLLAAFMAVAAQAQSSPNNVLAQLGVNGVTDKIYGTNASLYANYLIKTGTNGLIDISLIPSAVTPHPWYKTAFIDGVNGSDATNSGTATCPYKTFAYAANRATNDTAFIFTPGAYAGGTVTNANIHHVALIGVDPTNTVMTGTLRFNASLPSGTQDISLDCYAITLDTLNQYQYGLFNVGMYARAKANYVTRLYTTTNSALSVFVDPSAYLLNAVTGSNAVSYIKAYVPQGTASGQLTYWDGTAWVLTAAGATNQVLYGGATPAWGNFSVVYTNTAIPGDFVPAISNYYSLGSQAMPWSNGWFSAGVYINGTNVLDLIYSNSVALPSNVVFSTSNNTYAAGTTQTMDQASATNFTARELLVVNNTGYTSFVARAIPALGAQLNTVAGDGAGAGLISGTENTFFGYHTGNALDGSWNVAVGNLAMELASGCYASTAVGAGALQRAAHADRSTAIGVGAMNYATWTEYDTAVGGLALSALIHGDYNVAIGEWAMRNLTNGRGNTAIGQATFGGTSKCDFNTALGMNAGYNLTAGEGNIFLGASANGSAAAVSNEFVAGSAAYPTRNVYFGGGPGSVIPWTLHGEYASILGNQMSVTENATAGTQVVNYRTMTNYVASAVPSGVLKADGSVTWLGNQDAGGTVISNLGGFWMGGVLVTNLDTNAVTDIATGLMTVSNLSLHVNGDNAMAATLNVGGNTVSNISKMVFQNCSATGLHATAIGTNSSAFGRASYAEGIDTWASGAAAHAEGNLTTALGDYSHAEGEGTIASGYASHAAGSLSFAYGDYSFSGGKNATATHSNTWVWSAGTAVASSTNDEFTIAATNGIRLIGPASVSVDATSGTQVVNYQTLTNYVAGIGAVTGPQATNIVNSYIAGTGHMLMVEIGSTSVLYHVTSGGHTNKIGEFHTP